MSGAAGSGSARGTAGGTIRVGTSGWSYPGWVGSFYPEATPRAAMLAAYAARLSTVEAHSTFRRNPTPATIESWAATVGESFRFAPKAQASITHRRDLEGVDGRVTGFVAALAPLGPRLGPVMFSLPHHHPDLDRLDALLDALGGTAATAAFELAPAWHRDDVRHRLAARGAALVVVDRDGARVDPDHGGIVGGRLCYVRLRAGRYSDADLEAWAAGLTEAAATGSDVYAYFRHDDEGRGPRYALALDELVGPRRQ